jgi:TIR domain
MSCMAATPRQPAQVQLGEQLRTYRQAAGVNLEDAAARIGITARDLIDLEVGAKSCADKPEKDFIDLIDLYSLRHGEKLSLLEQYRECVLKSGGSDDSTAPLVFLCHSSGDKERVRDLYHRLQTDDVRCWFDEEDLLAGQDWEYEITRAIRRSKFVLACLSEASITRSGYVQKELKIALDVADKQPEGVAFIIPVRLEECEIPDRLQRWHWVDLFKDGGYERLVRGLGARPKTETSGAHALSAESIQDPATPVVYSSNDFNVAVTTTIQQAWWNCFGERTHMYAPRDYTKRPDGGVDGLIWPLDKPDVKVSFRTFPSPEIKLRSDEAIEMLKHSDTPCLIVTRLPLNQWTRDAIERAYPPPVRFLQWTGSNEDKEAIATYLRILRESLA